MNVLLGVPHADAVNTEILISRIVCVRLIIGDRIEAPDMPIYSDDYFFAILALIFPVKRISLRIPHSYFSISGCFNYLKY